MTDDIALQLHGHKDDLASCSFSHLLQGFKLADLHGRRRSEDVGCLTHEPCGIDLSARGDDLALSDALLLGGAGEGGRYLGGENDVLDEDTLNRDTPFVRDVTDNLSDLERDRFTLGDDRLDRARTDDVTKGRLCAFCQRLAQIRDTKRGAVWVRDLEINYRVTVRL